MAREMEVLEDLREGIDTFVERWQKIQRSSVKSVQAVTNTLVQLEHLDGPLGKLEGFQDIRKKAKGKLLVNLYDKLVPALEKSIKQFTRLMEMFEDLRQKVSTIQTFSESLRGSIEESPKLEDLVGFLDLIILSIQDILSMYESEFLVKLTIFKDLEESSLEVAVVSNYLTIWLAQPNIEKQALEKQLEDLDEHFELLRDVFEGKTGIQIPDVYRQTSTRY
ncbi:MAG: hypothetical protein KGY80_09935 [Candidatus Thorarchaeota archaeon]|nr:hypothetical protein [Candidatus Thorarchaeota archaeon]